MELLRGVEAEVILHMRRTIISQGRNRCWRVGCQTQWVGVLDKGELAFVEGNNDVNKLINCRR